jgi:phosphatidylinositol 4-kinase B
MSKSEIASSQVTVAADFFEHVWGPGVFVSRILPVFIALSAIGNVFAQSFAMPRGLWPIATGSCFLGIALMFWDLVKQEFAKEGILPFSKFWASDWPAKAPSSNQPRSYRTVINLR